MAELIFLGKGVAIKDSKTLLIDCGLGIGERIEQEGLEPDALVLTSRRPATCEGLGGLLERFPGLPVIEGKSIKKRGKKVNLGDIEARPFKVQQVRGIDAYGWRIKAGGKTLIYAPDSPNMSEKFLKGVDLAVLDTIRMDDSSFKVYDGLRIDLDDPKAAFKAISYEDLVNAHTLIMEEMEGRGVEHNIRDRLDRDSTKLEKHKKVDKKLLKRLRKMEDVLLIPSYVSIVGSSLKGKKEADIDWLFREESRNRNESHELALLKQFGRDAGYEHHFIYNPQGAHADYLPVYDLVLRKKKELKIRSEKSLDVLRIDLGSGGDSPKGYIGIDKREGAQIVHDLERGIPFGSSVVDEVRAWHFLEHHSNPQLIMEEVWRVLKPGGTFIFEVPSTEGPGAFADPTHKSYWNRLSFLYYVQDGLREYLGTPAKFEIVEMEERKDPEFGTVYVRGRLRALKEREVTKAKKVEPFGKFTPPKPRMAFYTEFFSAEELYEKWAKERLEEGIDLEEKLNGFRTLLQKRGDRVDIWFEDAKKSKVKQLPDLAKQLAKIPDDFILDASVGINRNGKPLPRISLMTLTAKKPKLGPDDVVVATVFDLPYWKEDLHERPLSERRKLLEQFYNRYLKTKNFALTSYNVVKSKGKLLSVAKRLAKVPGSEGCVAKTLDSEWSPTGATPDWAKIKTVLEIKVIVLDKTTNRAGSYNYNCGVLLGDTKFENVVDYKGKKIVKLGKTFNTSINASEGDVLTVEVEEIIVDEKRLVWLGPTVVDVDKARKEPYYAGQIIDLARRAGSVLQEVKTEKGTVGLYLVQPHAKWLAQGKKKLIIKSKPHRKYLNRRILVVSEGKAWALIVLKSVKPIGLEEFRKRRKEHLISEDERKRWWPDKRTLYAYEFAKIATLDPPKKIDVDRGIQVWIRDVPVGKEKEQVSPEDAFGICGEGVDEEESQKLAIDSEDELYSIITKKAIEGEEGETRGEVAARYWKANWFKVWPKSGRGRFVVHTHWRGLSEEESKLGEKALLQTKHSIHADLRLSGRKMLWGWSVFLGTTESNRKGIRLLTLSPDDALQVQPKLPQPRGWLTVEGVSEPGGVGATAKKWAKFFIQDSGSYDLGVMREHFFEVFLHGKKLKGRYLIAFAPVGEGGRKWLIKKPEDQRPYADTHDKEKVIKELRGKGQRYLVWAKPGMKPELIDVKGKAVAQQFLKKLARKALEPGFGVTKVEGEPRWWAVSSTTHEDLEGEVITRKALEIAHRLGVQEGFGPLLYEHVPKARIGECDGQLLVGDYLLETGTFSPDEKGQKGLKALSEAPPGRYKVSIGYYYWPWSKVGNKYKAIRIFERSATTKAANPFTSFEILRKERKVLSDSQIAALKEIFEIDDDEVQEWLEDEGEESVLKVLKAFESEEGVEEKKKRKPKKGEEEEEDEEKKKKKPPKKDEEEYPEKEKAGKAETALRGIAKLLKSIEPEKVRSKVAKLLSKAGLDLAKYGYGKYEYGTPAKKALEDLAKEVKSLKSIMMERDANLETIVDGLIEATKEGKVEALETFKTLLKEKSVEGAREPDEEKELSDEEKEIVEVAKKALKEVLEEQSSFDALYKHPRFQSLEK